MGCFLAWRLAESTREQLSQLSDRLQAWQLAARWVHPDDLHLTVAFFGAVPADEIGALEWSLDDVASAAQVPALSLPGLGAFSGSDAPRTVYAAVADPAEACSDLHRDVCDALGEPAEKNYRPHITLCRPRKGSDREHRGWRDLLEAHGLADWGACQLDGLELCRRVEAGYGQPRYQTLARWSG